MATGALPDDSVGAGRVEAGWDRARAVLAGASIEVGARHAAAIHALQFCFIPGTEVFITQLPRQRPQETIAAAAALRVAGYVPVPHVAARGLESRAALDTLIGGLREEAGVDRILAVAGDLDRPVGPFACVLDLLRADVLEARGIAAVAFAGHPEGHPRVPNQVLDQAIAAKVAAARARGLAPSVVTQFCFQSHPILAWLTHIRRLGIDVPVAVGLAGPAELRTLAAFALRCGVGNSARVLRRRAGLVGRLIGHNPADRIALDVGRAVAAGAAPQVARLHIFPFGGTARAGAWRATMLARLAHRS